MIFKQFFLRQNHSAVLIMLDVMLFVDTEMAAILFNKIIWSASVVI